MGYSHGKHWTQEEILESVKICMEDTGLSRMPSRNELNRYFGNTVITNALRRFPGGYYEIAKILDVQMKESETQFGRSGEELAQAALKLRRALDGANPTPKDVEECEMNLLEELADIKVAFTVYLADSKPCIKSRVSEEINKTAEIKLDRWLSRLEAKEQSNE